MAGSDLDSPAGPEPAETRTRPRSRAWPLLKRLWPWLKPYQVHAWVCFVMLLLSAPLNLISPLIVRRVVDDAVQSKSVQEVLLWGSVLAGLTLLDVLLGLAIGRASILLRIKVIRDLRLRLYHHMQRLSWRFYSERETGHLMSRQADDVSNLGGVMADVFARGLVDALRAAGCAAIIFVIEWRLAGGGFVLAFLLLGVQYLVSGPMR